MRSDFNKVLTERPRTPSRHDGYPKGSKREVQRLDLEDLPNRESISRKWLRGYGGKEFTDLLGPLKKFLRSNVNRPWNNVYSEFREHFYPSNKSLIHINGHFKDLVVKDVVMIDGKPCAVNHMWRGHNVPLSPGELYVDPRTGILREVKVKKKPIRPKPEPVSLVISKTLQLHKHKGIWYQVTVRPFDPKRFTEVRMVTYGYYNKSPHRVENFSYYDKVLGQSFDSLPAMTKFYHGTFEPVSKRQCSRKELREFNLTNTPKEP